MRRSGLTLVLAAMAATVVACVLPATRFETHLETIGVELPVVVLDHTGLVAAVAPEVASAPGVQNLAGQPDVLVVGWSSGACDTAATLDFRTQEPGYLLELATQTGPGPCDAVELAWAIGVYLATPLDAANVTFVATP